MDLIKNVNFLLSRWIAACSWWGHEMQVEAFGCGLCWNELWQHWPIPAPWSVGDSPTSFQSEQITTKLITLVQLCKSSNSGFLNAFLTETAPTTSSGREGWELGTVGCCAISSPPTVFGGDCPGVVDWFQLDEVWIAHAQDELVANSSKGFQGFYSALFLSSDSLKWKRDAFKMHTFKYVDVF